MRVEADGVTLVRTGEELGYHGETLSSPSWCAHTVVKRSGWLADPPFSTGQGNASVFIEKRAPVPPRTMFPFSRILFGAVQVDPSPQGSGDAKFELPGGQRNWQLFNDRHSVIVDVLAGNVCNCSERIGYPQFKELPEGAMVTMHWGPAESGSLSLSFSWSHNGELMATTRPVTLDTSKPWHICLVSWGPGTSGGRDGVFRLL